MGYSNIWNMYVRNGLVKSRSDLRYSFRWERASVTNESSKKDAMDREAGKKKKKRNGEKKTDCLISITISQYCVLCACAYHSARGWAARAQHHYMLTSMCTVCMQYAQRIIEQRLKTHALIWFVHAKLPTPFQSHFSILVSIFFLFFIFILEYFCRRLRRWLRRRWRWPRRRWRRLRAQE